METVDLNYVNYDLLRNMLSSERSQNQLEPLNEDFFGKCEGFVGVQEKILKDNFSMEQARVLENSKKIVGELKDLRLRKILFKSLRDLETGAINSSGLAVEEKEFYRSLVSMLSEYKRKQEKKEMVQLKVLVDLPKLQAPDGSEFGPFSAGEAVSIGIEAAELLLRKNAAEKI